VNGFLLDENIPNRLRFKPSKPILHARELGVSPSDLDLWEYAKRHNLVIVSKDADFSERILVNMPPPRVVHLRFGNLRLASFHDHLARLWPEIEELLVKNKLVNVDLDRLEAVA
jgi:predicted nuclease of predicted toxin-antitoxin system